LAEDDCPRISSRTYFGAASFTIGPEFLIALNKANDIVAEQRLKRATDLIEARASLRSRHGDADRSRECVNNRRRCSGTHGDDLPADGRESGNSLPGGRNIGA
jgi:hypothetical protein